MGYTPSPLATADVPRKRHAPAPRAILRVGTDIQSVSSIEASIRSHGTRYLQRIFTEHEVDSCGGPQADPVTLAPGLAARFCAKEATIKLLRPIDVTPGWTDIEVVRQDGGWTELKLTGRAATLAHASGIRHVSISLSHEKEFAIATVIGSGDGTDLWEE